MVEELAVEMAMPKRPSFWRTGKGITIIIGCLCVILAALLSWWLARGTIKSISARLDTMVYTVEPEFSTRIGKILVAQGDHVQSGQPIATIDSSSFLTSTENSGTDAGFSNRLNLAMRTERQLAARANQARAEEERLQKIYQERVTDHVRVLLALRSHRGNQDSLRQLSQAEASARAVMNEANAAFEQASRGRAALEQELNKIRSQLIRSGVKPEAFAAQVVAQAEPLPQIANELYAPVAGRIMKVEVQPGQTVEKGQTLFIIVPTGQNYLSHLWVEAWFPIDKAREIEVGQKALVKFGNGIHLEGKVEEIAPPVIYSGKGSPINLGSTSKSQTQADSTKFLPVRIAPVNPADAQTIQPGAKAECQIQTRYVLGLTWFD